MSECSLDCENFGLFVRGSFLYDDLVEDSQTDRTPISESGKDLADSYLRLLDAFVYGRWDLAGHELDIRAGRQVFNWGKSTFFAVPAATQAVAAPALDESGQRSTS